MKGPQPAGVPGAGRKRDVDRGPLGLRSADLGGSPGAGEQGIRVLVQADGQHPRVIPERRLHSVTVMGVHVDVGDPLRALAQQPRDRDGRVVVDAEPAGVPGHRVVQAAGDTDPMLRGRSPDGPGRGQRGSRHHGGCLMHPGNTGSSSVPSPCMSRTRVVSSCLSGAWGSVLPASRTSPIYAGSWMSSSSASEAVAGTSIETPSWRPRPKAWASSIVSLSRSGAIG
jgi:hypothetical protein